MKAKDSENLNKIIQAVNEIIPNVDISFIENETAINLSIELPKAGVIGRPKRLNIIETSMTPGGTL
jgi:hypothetical protein